jgi:hypothetical protein
MLLLSVAPTNSERSINPSDLDTRPSLSPLHEDQASSVQTVAHEPPKSPRKSQPLANNIPFSSPVVDEVAVVEEKPAVAQPATIHAEEPTITPPETVLPSKEPVLTPSDSQAAANISNSVAETQIEVQAVNMSKEVESSIMTEDVVESQESNDTANDDGDDEDEEENANEEDGSSATNDTKRSASTTSDSGAPVNRAQLLKQRMAERSTKKNFTPVEAPVDPIQHVKPKKKKKTTVVTTTVSSKKV